MDRSALLGNLWEKIDAFFEKVQTRYPGELACRPGCSSCCLGGLSVTEVEANAIRGLLATLDDPTRADLARAALTETQAHCVALDADGRCRIYAARPIVCRSHGLPIKLDDAFTRDSARTEIRRLPLIDACSLNFVETLDAVSADCVLDQTTLSTTLALIDRAEDLETPRERVSLASLLSSAPRPKAVPKI